MTALWRRGIRWGAVLVGIVAVLAAAVVGIATQSAFGRERVRRIAERMVGAAMTGSLTLGALRFGPGCALAIDSARLRDAADSLLISVGPTRAQCRFAALVRGKLVLTAIEVREPRVVMRELPGGEWNWTRAFGADTTTAETESALRVDGSLRVHGGTLVIETFTGALDPTEAGHAAPVVRRQITGLDIDIPSLRTSEGDALAVAEVERFAAHISDPALILREARGHVRVTGDSLRFDIARLALPGSAGRAMGVISWKESGPTRFRLTVAADTVSLADVTGLLPFLPDSGGGSLRFAMSSSADGSIVDYTLSEVKLRSGGSYLRGGATFAIGDSLVALRDVAVTAEPLETALLGSMSGVQVPPWARGTLRGSLVAQGGGLDRLVIDSLSVRFAGAGMRGESRAVHARGAIQLAPDLAFAGFRVRTDGLDLRPACAHDPGPPAAHGPPNGGGHARLLAGRSAHLRCDDRVRRRRRGAAHEGWRPHVDGPALGGRDGRGAPARHRGARQQLPGTGSRAECEGTDPSDGNAACARGDDRPPGHSRHGGDRRQFDLEAPGLAGRATVHVRQLDLAGVLGPSAIVAGVLGANIVFDVRGDSLSALEGSVELTDIAGHVNTHRCRAILVRLRLADGWLRADSVSVVSSAGSVRGRGSLGLRRELRDTLTVEAEGIAIRRLLAGIADSAGADSMDGTLGVRARLVGSVDSLDVEAHAEAIGLVMPPTRARRAHGEHRGYGTSARRTRERGRAHRLGRGRRDLSGDGGSECENERRRDVAGRGCHCGG